VCVWCVCVCLCVCVHVRAFVPSKPRTPEPLVQPAGAVNVAATGMRLAGTAGPAVCCPDQPAVSFQRQPSIGASVPWLLDTAAPQRPVECVNGI